VFSAGLRPAPSSTEGHDRAARAAARAGRSRRGAVRGETDRSTRARASARARAALGGQRDRRPRAGAPVEGGAAAPLRGARCGRGRADRSTAARASPPARSPGPAPRGPRGTLSPGSWSEWFVRPFASGATVRGVGPRQGRPRAATIAETRPSRAGTRTAGAACAPIRSPAARSPGRKPTGAPSTACCHSCASPSRGAHRVPVGGDLEAEHGSVESRRRGEGTGRPLGQVTSDERGLGCELRHALRSPGLRVARRAGGRCSQADHQPVVAGVVQGELVVP